MRLAKAATAAVLLASAAGAQAAEINGTTAKNWQTSNPQMKVYAGAAFYSPDDLQGPGDASDPLNIHPLAQATMAAVGDNYNVPKNANADLSNLPAGETIRFVGFVEYNVDGGLAGLADFADLSTNDPNTPFTYSFNLNFTANSDSATEGKVQNATFSTSFVTTLNQLISGWQGDGKGNYVWNALYPAQATPSGLLGFASTSMPDWWDDFTTGYGAGWANSAFIEVGGDVSITAAPVPTPAAAGAGLVLLTGMALRRTRKA